MSEQYPVDRWQHESADSEPTLQPGYAWDAINGEGWDRNTPEGSFLADRDGQGGLYSMGGGEIDLFDQPVADESRLSEDPFGGGRTAYRDDNEELGYFGITPEN